MKTLIYIAYALKPNREEGIMITYTILLYILMGIYLNSLYRAMKTERAESKASLYMAAEATVNARLKKEGIII